RRQADARLDAPHPGRDGLLGRDHERPDAAGAVDVRAPAQLDGHGPFPAVDADHAHVLAVLLAEEHHRALAPRLGDRHDAPRHGQVGLHPAVHELLDLRELRRRQRVSVREVEAQAVGRDERAGLRHVRAQHAAQGGVQQVRGRVVLLRLVAGGVDHGPHPGARRELAPDDLGLVEVEAVAGAARAADERAAARPLELADVADLAAALGIEGRAVQHHDAGVALAQDVDLAALAHDADYRRLGVERFVPDELGLAGALGDRAQRVGALGEQAPLADVAARGAPRLLPRGLVAGAVDGDAALGGQLLGEVEGEAVRLPQVERDVARQHLALELGQQVADALDAGLERAEELLLLGLDDAHHAVPTV